MGLSNLVVSPTALVAGEPATITWSGSNQTGTPLVGDWTDGVYLSTDGLWDINDPLLGTVAHTGGLAQGEVYTGSLNAVIPGTLPGNYHILVRSDVTNQERETDEANNLVVSPPLTVSVHALVSNGSASSGSLTSADPADYYAIHVNGGDNLGLVLDGLAASGVNELYASFEAIPTRLSYDFRSVKDETFVDRQDQIAGAHRAARWRDLLYTCLRRSDRFVGLEPLSALRHDRAVRRHVDHSRSGEQHGETLAGGPSLDTVSLIGAGFDDTASVEFVGEDGTVYDLAILTIVSSSLLTCSLNLPNWPVGCYRTSGLRGFNIHHPSEFVPRSSPEVYSKLEHELITPSFVPVSIFQSDRPFGSSTEIQATPRCSRLLELHGTFGARLTTDINQRFPLLVLTHLLELPIRSRFWPWAPARLPGFSSRANPSESRFITSGLTQNARLRPHHVYLGKHDGG